MRGFTVMLPCFDLRKNAHKKINPFRGIITIAHPIPKVNSLLASFGVFF
jgi:hypothetical protein